MEKLVFIVARLVPEAEEVEDEQIEKEILEEVKAPWIAEVKKVTVLEE